MTVINPNAIHEGEEVTIQDEAKNVARGPAGFDGESNIILKAFKTEIRFARWSNQARDGLGGYVTVKGIKIVGHQPPLDYLAFDAVPKQRFRSNPT